MRLNSGGVLTPSEFYANSLDKNMQGVYTTMELRLIRHATMLLSLGATKLLVDPIFSPAGAMPPIDNSSNDRRNPLVELPLSESELRNVDAVLLTHTHKDHFDGAAAKSLAKDTTIFCQVADEQKLKELGFSQVKPISDVLIWNGARLIRTDGEHGTGIIGQKMGPVYRLCNYKSRRTDYLYHW